MRRYVTALLVKEMITAGTPVTDAGLELSILVGMGKELP
jgi:hypothetical protein